MRLFTRSSGELIDDAISFSVTAERKTDILWLKIVLSATAKNDVEVELSTWDKRHKVAKKDDLARVPRFAITDVNQYLISYLKIDLPDNFRNLDVKLRSGSGQPFVLYELALEEYIDLSDVSFSENLDRLHSIPIPWDEQLTKQVDSNRHYVAQIAIDSNKPSERNAGLINVLYFDSDRKLIGDWSALGARVHSHGFLKKLRGGQGGHINIIRFSTPNHCRFVEFRYRASNSQRNKFQLKNLMMSGLIRDDQVTKMASELKQLDGIDPQKMILVYAAAGELDEINIDPRLKMMTKEFIKFGYIIVFVYNRAHSSSSVLKFQEIGREGGVIQIPNDLFIGFRDRIIAYGNGGGRAIISFPDAGSPSLLNALVDGGWQCAFDLDEDWEELHFYGAAKWYRNTFERYLIQRCHFAAAASEALRERCLALGAHADRVHVVRNGTGRICRHVENDGEVRNVRSARELRKIGYFGEEVGGSWFDWRSISKLAIAKPDITVEIISTSNKNYKKEASNVRLLNLKDIEEIRMMASKWDAGIVPLAFGRRTFSSDPVGVYDYICMNIPVIASEIEQIRAYPHVFVYSDAEDVESAVDRALSCCLDISLNEAFSEENAWSVRAGAMIDLFRNR